MNFYLSLLGRIDTARSEREQIPTGFAMHVNNGLRAAVEALMASYPSVAGVIGANEFRALARPFVLAHPPTDSRLFLYRGSFGDRLEVWRDLAAKDRMWTEADDAMITTPLPPAGAAFLDACRAGLTLPEAVQAALLTDEDTDVQALLTTFFKLGAFCKPLQEMYDACGRLGVDAGQAAKPPGTEHASVQLATAQQKRKLACHFKTRRSHSI